MAKKKNSMALFEVISKTRDKNPDSEVIVPNWVRPDQQDQSPDDQAPAPDQQAPEPAEQTAAPAAPPPPPVQAPEPQGQPAVAQPAAEPEPTVIPTTATRTPRPAAAPETSETSEPPIWTTDGNRLTLSLNYVSCMAVSMGVLVLLAGAFVLGRLTASDSGATGAPNGDVIEREVGKYYMVIQTLAGRTSAVHKEANRIAKFCTDNGEPAQVMRVNDNLIVWSYTPFDSKTGDDVNGHALRVLELGAKYARQYRSNIKFAQPQANGKLVPIMYQHKKEK